MIKYKIKSVFWPHHTSLQKIIISIYDAQTIRTRLFAPASKVKRQPTRPARGASDFQRSNSPWKKPSSPTSRFKTAAANTEQLASIASVFAPGPASLRRPWPIFGAQAEGAKGGPRGEGSAAIHPVCTPVHALPVCVWVCVSLFWPTRATDAISIRSAFRTVRRDAALQQVCCRIRISVLRLWFGLTFRWGLGFLSWAVCGLVCAWMCFGLKMFRNGWVLRVFKLWEIWFSFWLYWKGSV